MREPLRVGVLASGRGSNFRALVLAAESGRMPAAVVVLVADRAGAPVLDIAREHRIEAVVVDPRQHPSREAHEKAVIGVLEERRVGLVCLAGYMRLLTAGLRRRTSAGRLLNIHPSLLPAFPGLHAAAPGPRATASACRAPPCTSWTRASTAGPSCCRPRCRCEPDDTEESLAARILVEEHRIYPEAVRLFAEGRLEIHGRRVTIRETP